MDFIDKLSLHPDLKKAGTFIFWEHWSDTGPFVSTNGSVQDLLFTMVFAYIKKTEASTHANAFSNYIYDPQEGP